MNREYDLIDTLLALLLLLALLASSVWGHAAISVHFG